MKLVSRNPFNGEVLEERESQTYSEVVDVLAKAQKGYLHNSSLSLPERVSKIARLKEALLESLQDLAKTATQEMGKPMLESRAELSKCAELCQFYADNAEKFLRPGSIESSASSSYVRYDPIGVVLGIMPWNFPYWQVFRFAVPTILAGNAVVLKHASNVSMCADRIAKLFLKAGFTNNEYQPIYVGGREMAAIIDHDDVQGVSLTGSEAAGIAAGIEAARKVKPVVLELGGSNAFVTLEDADVSVAVKKTVGGRMLNAGQSCIAAKRILLHKSKRDEFVALYTEKMGRINPGDPSLDETRLGPLVSEDAAQELEEQVRKGISEGAKVLLQGSREGALFSPWVLEVDDIGNSLMQEETFGPVSVIYTYGDEAEVPDLVHSTRFGLGVSLFTGDPSRIEGLINTLNEGAVFVNELVKSESALPFGGVKNSGIGRELGRDGIRAFTNTKTVYIA